MASLDRACKLLLWASPRTRHRDARRPAPASRRRSFAVHRRLESMPGQGVGASVLRKEDDRFLRGRGQYVADFRVAGMREVAFVRSPVAHGRILDVHVPDAHRSVVFTAEDLADVKPIRAATALSGFKHS